MQNTTVSGSEKIVNDFIVVKMASMVMVQQLTGNSSRCSKFVVQQKSAQIVEAMYMASTIQSSIEKASLECATIMQQWKTVCGTAVKKCATVQHTIFLEGDDMIIVEKAGVCDTILSFIMLEVEQVTPMTGVYGIKSLSSMSEV